MREEALKNLLRECSAYITEKTKEIYSLVPGSGNVDGKVMFIGSSPSSKEEATGIFLEGKTSDTFDAFLESAELDREDVYMTYAVKYRPYTVNEKTGRIVSRDVMDDEIELFMPYLNREIEMIKPRLIVTLGDIAYKAVSNMEMLEASSVGVKKTLTISDIIYDVMPMPHPKDKFFSKVASRSDVIEMISAGAGVDTSFDTSLDEGAEDDFTSLSEATLDATKNALGSELDYVVGDDLADAPSYDDIAYEEPAMYEPVKPSGRRLGVRRKKVNNSGKRKVILVYGGTNLADDPAYVVADRVSSVLSELNVMIRRIDLYKNDYSIDAFIDELEDADGAILATTVEWYGIGGALQTFLDKCFNSGRLEIFSGAYLFGVVVSRQSYERDAYNHLIKSWEILGGVEGVSLQTCIANSADLETDNELLMAVDKKAEDYYRIINQQRLVMPTSIQGNKVLFKVPVKVQVDEGEQMIIKQVVSGDNKEQAIENQMSFITNYDEFIEKQQKDIEDISSLFKERLTVRSDITTKTFPEIFEYKYKPDKTFSDCTISWVVNDRNSESFILDFKGARLKAGFGKKQDADVVMSSSFDVLSKIADGKLTVQRAFMTGEIKAKGNFTLLYKLDQLFAF